MGISELVRSIDWEHESYPEYQHFAVIPFFALFFPTVRFFLDRFVFEKVGTRLIFGNGQQTIAVETYERKKKIRKFKESAWKCVYFLSAELLVLFVTYDEPWFTNTSYFWVGPGKQAWPDQKIKLKLKTVYMFARVGSVILALHDATDVFLEVGKMSKYRGAETLASTLKVKTNTKIDHYNNLQLWLDMREETEANNNGKKDGSAPLQLGEILGFAFVKERRGWLKRSPSPARGVMMIDVVMSDGERVEDDRRQEMIGLSSFKSDDRTDSSSNWRRQTDRER
ncbi:hypothetical protein RHGRI_033753 [Rhododendron griersonianum]|uniref:Uncharacterized protein n=1 Tax=Rhododendron griersonianum TaxID=479676 RepID=A0AAV6HY15_9ERIC|nr:hypothetical protein RHGRI_033753 [Rhododendron griersonianum]